MSWLQRIWRSSLGKKYIMAVSGCALVLFVIGHMVGNLQIFLGPEAINRYAAFLQGNPALLWSARLGLLVLAGLHLAAAARLSRENLAARPVPYERYEAVAASYASRTMLMSGLIVLAFLVYHLLHFTVQVPAVNLAGQDFHALQDAQGRHDVYAMMIQGFSQPVVSVFYLVGVGLLCLHLSHGVNGMFQSVGWRCQSCARCLERCAQFLAVVVFLGYAAIPLAVLADRKLHLIQIFK